MEMENTGTERLEVAFLSKQQKLGITVMIMSGVFFVLVDKIMDYMLKQYESTHLVKTLRKKDKAQYMFKNYFMSLTHSIITSIWVMSCLYMDPRLHRDMINPSSPMSVSLVCFSIGYFLHDMYHILANDHSRSSMELIPHHCIVVFCFGISICIELYVAYAVVALLVEVNSIFLHGRQLLVITQYPRDRKLYRINSLINIGTFILFRLSPLAWMTRWLVSNREIVPVLLYTIGSAGMAIIMIINLVLFYRLLNSDFIKKSKFRVKE